MKDLKCGLRLCKYNKGYSCVANAIEIANNTDCLTYEKSDKKNKDMFENASEFVPANYNVDTEVSCGADCLFNKDKKCMANGITIMNSEGIGDANCLTYVKK